MFPSSEYLVTGKVTTLTLGNTSFKQNYPYRMQRKVSNMEGIDIIR